MKLKRLSVCIALAFSSQAFADEAIVIPEVDITAKKIQALPTLSGSTLNQSELTSARTRSSDTAALLDGQPGVSVFSAGGVSSLPAIHGMADDRVRVQVDGMDLIASCPNHMNSPLSYIDPSNVGSVNVFAGITPVSVGGDSIGGTIQVNSAAPQFAADGSTLLTGELGAFYRSNGQAKGGNLSATLANESFNIHYAGSTAQSDNYSAGSGFKTASAAATDKPSNWIPSDVVASSAYKTQNHALGFAYRTDRHLVELKLALQDIPYELYPNQRMDMLSNKSQQSKLRYAGDFDWGNLEASVWHENVDHFMDFGADKQFTYGSAVKTSTSTSTIVATGMPMYTQGVTNGMKLKGDITLAEQQVLRVGAEVQNYRLNDWWPSSPASLAGMESRMSTTAMWMPATYGGMAPNTFWNISNGKRDRLAMFAELDTRWNSQWNGLFGARVEQVSTEAGAVQGYNNVTASYKDSAAAFNKQNRQIIDHNLDLTALARYTPSEVQALEVGYARKTRSPNLYERYSWSQNSMALIMNNFVGDGNGYLGNVNLQPEVANTVSTTIDLHDVVDTWGVKATPYYTYVENYIDAVRCAGTGSGMTSLCGGTANNTATTFVQMQYANQSASLYGIDISGHIALSESSAWGTLNATGVLGYVRGKNQTTGDNLYNIMPLNLKLALIQKVGNWGNRLEVQLVDAKSNISSVRNEVKTSGYGLMNLRASYDLGKVRIDAGIDNLFNQLYSLPLGGAYTGQGTTMSTNGIPYGVAVPGMGRSLSTSLTVKF